MNTRTARLLRRYANQETTAGQPLRTKREVTQLWHSTPWKQRARLRRWLRRHLRPSAWLSFYGGTVASKGWGTALRNTQ